MKGQLALVICWLTPIFIHAANIDEMSGKVIELRRETEELNTQYELRKQQIVEELKTQAITTTIFGDDFFLNAESDGKL